MSRTYSGIEFSPNGVRHEGNLHRIDCDLCGEFVERKRFARRDHNERTDVGYSIPEGLYFEGTAGDEAPFALMGWSSFLTTVKKGSSHRSEIEGYDVRCEYEQIDICPRHVGDVLGMINRTRPVKP